MSSTVTQIQTRFQTMYPQCDPNTLTELFNEANKIIAARVQCRNGTVVVALSAGVQEYQHDPNGLITQTHEVYYYPSGTLSAGSQLAQMDPDRLAALQTEWRTQSQTEGVPTEYYIISAPANANSTGGQAVIGFYPVPPSSTVGSNPGYPNVTLNVTTTAVMSGSDTVPVNLLNDDIYLFLMAERWCKYRQPTDLARYYDQSAGKYFSEIEIEKNIAYVKQIGALGMVTDPVLGGPGSELIQPGVHTMRTVIAQFLTIYPMCEMSFAQILFQDAYKRAATRIQFRNGTVDIDLVAGQQEYDYDPTGQVVQIHSVYYLPSSDPTTWTIIWARDKDQFDLLRPGWRAWQTTSNPFEVYVSSAPANSNNTGGQGVIGLYPPPATSSTGTTPNDYPKLRVWVTTTAVPAMDDPLPVNIQNDNLYIYQMCEDFARRRKPEDLPRWFDSNERISLAEKEFQANIKVVQNIQATTSVQFIPSWVGGMF